MYNVTIFKSRFSRCLICLESFTRADYHKNGGFRPNLSHFLIFDQMSMTFVHSASRGNVKARSQFQFLLRFFITHPLVHIHQKKKIALEIAAKIARSPGNEDGVKYLRNLVPRACDPREGTRGSGIIRFREESDWPLKWNA